MSQEIVRVQALPAAPVTQTDAPTFSLGAMIAIAVGAILLGVAATHFVMKPKEEAALEETPRRRKRKR